ncbi:hypothetical protein F4775DRAFT_346995 [Biscogniauxia sp. FL1348]|nr:hypothetical protein F4775DRAFT_346995 [Biscogniauxia sp. FL1348]
MEVATLMTQMHENLSEIHKTIAGLSIEKHDSKIDEVEQKRDLVVESLQANFEKEQEEISVKRNAEIQEISERRRKEDEEREKRRRQEDEERNANNQAEDQRRYDLLHSEIRHVEDETEEQLDLIEAEAKQLIDQGRERIRLLEERRREINRLIDEQLKSPLPDVPIRKRDRATKKPRITASSMPMLHSADHEQGRDTDEKRHDKAVTGDFTTSHIQPDIQPETQHAENDDSHISPITRDSRQSGGIYEHTQSFLQLEEGQLSSRDASSQGDSLLADDEVERTRGVPTSPVFDQEMPQVAETKETSRPDGHHGVEPHSSSALVEPSAKVELDLSPAEPGKGDDHSAMSLSSPSSPLEAHNTEPTNTNTLVKQTGDHLLEENDSSTYAGQPKEELDLKTLAQETIHLSNSQEGESEDVQELLNKNNTEESPETQIYTHSDRSQDLQDGVDASLPNEQIHGTHQMEQSSKPVLAEENEPLAMPRSPLTSPTAIGEPANPMSVGSDRNGTSESEVWGSESRSQTASHVSEDEDGHSVATNTSHDDHESKDGEKPPAATLLERHVPPAQQDPNPDSTISAEDLPQENDLSSPNDQHPILALNSSIHHNALNDIHHLHLDAEGVKLDEQPEVTRPVEESHADSYEPNQPAGDLHGRATHPDSELDPHNLESPSSVGQIITSSTEERKDANVKEVDLHPNDSWEEETYHLTHADADEASPAHDIKGGTTHHEDDVPSYSKDGNAIVIDLDEQQDLPKSAAQGLESINNDHTNGKQNSHPNPDLPGKPYETPLSSPQLENNPDSVNLPLHSPETELHLLNTAEGESHTQQELEQGNISPVDASVELYESSFAREIQTQQHIHGELHTEEPLRQIAHSPLPVENDTMHGQDDLFDDDTNSSHSYENEEIDQENLDERALRQPVEYVANEPPDTPRTAVPSSGGTQLNEEERHHENSAEFQHTKETLPTLSEKERHDEALSIQNETEPKTPTASIFQAQPDQDLADQEVDTSLSPSKGLAASRHAPETQPQTPSHDDLQQADEDLEPELFVPRDVTNLPWHARNDSVPQSMRSESTLDSAPSSPVHSTSSNQQYHEPVIRESWSTHTGSTGRLRNNSQLTDRSASDEFDPFRFDTSKPIPPSSLDPDSQRRDPATATDSQRLSSSNRNSLGGSPMFQKIRNLFEAPGAAGSEPTSSSLGNSRPTSAIFTGAVNPQDVSSPVKPVAPSRVDRQGYYANDEEDDRIGEHTALLAGPGPGAGAN